MLFQTVLFSKILFEHIIVYVHWVNSNPLLFCKYPSILRDRFLFAFADLLTSNAIQIVAIRFDLGLISKISDYKASSPLQVFKQQII